MKRAALVLMAVSLIAGIAFATDLYYGDISGISPNGKYTAEAKSPANKDGKWVNPFQKDFTVTFKSTQSGETIWAWHQQEDDASPVQLIPADDGMLVMQDAHDQYRVFDTKGVSSQPISARASISAKDWKRFTVRTTARVNWQQYSKQGFYTNNQITYFYLRTYWGHIFALSLQDGKETRDSDVRKAIEAKVIQETRDWIKGFDGEYYFKCPNCDDNHVKPEIAEHLFIIKKHGIREGKLITKNALTKLSDGRNAELEDYLNRL